MHASLRRFHVFAGPIAVAALLGACSAPPSEPADANETSEAELGAASVIAGFPDNSLYQIDAASPIAGEVTLIAFTTASSYWAYRCTDAACTATESLVGTYRRSRSTLSLYTSAHRFLGNWAYTVRHGALSLRRYGTHDRYTLDPVSESLCDASGGSWADDDSGPHGFICACPDGKDWSASGCLPCDTPACGTVCAAPLSACAGACVDLATDPANCGACNTTCSKLQGCQSGVCAACPAGQRACASRCVDANQNCGACGVACGPTQTCVADVCQ